MNGQAAANTDRLLYQTSDEHDGAYADKVYVTDQGAITICVGGSCCTRTLEEWLDLGWPPPRNRPAEPDEGRSPDTSGSCRYPDPVPVSLSVREGLMGCGHPLSAVVSGGEGTNYCGRCEDEARAVQEGQDEALGASGARRVEEGHP